MIWLPGRPGCHYTSHRGISCGNRGGEEEDIQEAGEEEADYSGWGEFKSGAGTVEGAEGRRKVGHGLSVAPTFSSFPLFRGKSRIKSRRKTGQRGQTTQHPLWITFALELFPGRVSLRINVVVNLWKLSPGEGTLLVFCCCWWFFFLFFLNGF